MIQLNHNTSSNTFAILTNSTGSELFVEFIQDYNKWVSYGTASVYTLGQYLIGNITGSQVPTASGLYTVNFYESSTSGSLIWSTWTPVWTTLTSLWPSYSGSSVTTTGSLIDVERAWISGSDQTSINYYTSSNDYGQFYTYDG